MKPKYTKTGNESIDLKVESMYAKIDEFYKKIKKGVTEVEYSAMEKEIYSIADEIDTLQSTAKDGGQNDYSYADSKMAEIRSELDQYIIEFEFIKNNEKNGNSSRTRAKLKKAYELDEELKDAEEKLANRDYTVDEADDVVDALYIKYQEVNSYNGIE